MNKSLIKFFSLSLAISSIGLLAGFSVAFANMNKNISSNISVAPVNSSLANTTSSNTWNDESLISSNDYLSNTNTPNGYLTILNKSINMITWFGTKSWSYDVSNSPFLTQAGISNYNASSSTIVIHVYYLAHYDRILVYGTVNSTITYIFQLNSDGTEYYVNNNDINKVKNSSLVSSKDSGLISSGYSVQLLNDNSAIILPKTFDKAGDSISASKFTFNNFTLTPVNYDISRWKSITSGTPHDIYNYSFGSIIGFAESSNSQTSYLMVSASYPHNSTSAYVCVLFIKFINNVFNSVDKSVVSGVSNTSVNLEKAYFKSVNTIVNGLPLTYVSMLTNISDPNSLQVGPDSNLSSGWGEKVYLVVELVPDSGFINSYYVLKSAECMIMDIYINPYNARPYVLVKKNSNNLFYFSDLLTNKSNNNSQGSFLMRVVNWNNFPTVNTNTDTSRIDLIWRPIFEKNVNDLTKLNGLVSVLNYSDSTSTTWSSSSTKKFSITFNTDSIQSVTFDDFHATIISSYQDLSTKYYYLLPQDVTNSIFEEYIYLKNATGDSTTKPFTSSISIPTNGLTISNDNGTISGTVNLDITKWWATSTANGSSNIYTIPISVNITGLATNTSLNFQIVTNSDVDSTKYNKILELQKSKYPSEVTTDEILNYFLVKGSSIKLTTDNISITNSTSSSTQDTTKYIQVTTNDNDGTLSISYNLTSVMSPSITVKSGSYTFYNFKHLSAWNQISLNESAWNTLKMSKSPFQVSISDIISSLNLSSGYNTDPSYWTWTPTHNEQSNKSGYIQDSVNGSLTGTITYNRDKGGVSSSVPSTYTTFTIDETKGSGFLTISKLLGSDANTTIYYNQNNASKLASSYDLDKVKSDFNSILNNSLVFYNNWTTYKNLNYQIISSSNNKIVFTMSYKDTVQTNFKKSDGTSLVLDSDWINAIKSSSNNVLALSSNYTFDYDLTVVKYNYDLTFSNNTISIESVLQSSSTSGQNYGKIQPSKFISKFYNSETDDYLSFIKEFDLIKLPTDKTAINYYYVSNVQLTSDNTNGTVTVYYTFIFPNAGDSSGSSSTSSIVLNGFLTNQEISNDWLFKCTVIVVAFLVILISGATGTIVYKKVSNSKRKKYGHGSRRDDLNLEYAERNIKAYNVDRNRIRNTINKNTLNKGTNRTSESVKSYNKKMNELKKLKSLKEEK